MTILRYSDLPTISAWKPTQWKMAQVLEKIRKRRTWRPLMPGNIRAAEYMLAQGLIEQSIGARSGHLEYELTERGAAFAYFFILEDYKE